MALLVVSGIASASEAPSYAFGAGVQHIPSWIGASTHRNQLLPYVDIDLPEIGELSTVDGLTVDLIHGTHWHGGPYGNYMWGRSHEDLGTLGGKVTSLSPRLQGGGYIEYAFDEQWSVGSRVSHDTDGAGAYLDVYGDLKLPDIGYIEQSFELQWQAMNGPAMRRFFGLSADEATSIGTAPWRPGAGAQMAYIEYDAFLPTSEHTGFALSINIGRLLGAAANSPLVRSYGSRTQISQTLAFVYHF
ncbi:MltA-interacting protein MipA [Luteibacter rhizovicinus]|uniref:MltA-interacting protein MipA n=1 Tax=Luteibacter rhizovicinus TaxID=242606 RepID=A0A4R3YSL8_9GAMM|nr:MipA/OmpV family protein [Luteibacter rhizovicinus]TCV94063.1 MltA-interacting protein MipA [Luteibacter rhizovicinus]